MHHTEFPMFPLRADTWEFVTTSNSAPPSRGGAPDLAAGRPWWLVQVVPAQVSPDKYHPQIAYLWARRRSALPNDNPHIVDVPQEPA